MNRILLAMLSLIVTGCAATPPPSGSPHRAEMIFVPPVSVHETVQCISLRQVRSTRVIDRIGIIYEMPNQKTWFNRPQWGASLLDDDLMLVTQTGGSLCSGDIVRFLDSSPVGFRGAIALGPFISYSDRQ